MRLAVVAITASTRKIRPRWRLIENRPRFAQQVQVAWRPGDSGTSLTSHRPQNLFLAQIQLLS